jgi:hypothetical protein
MGRGAASSGWGRRGLQVRAPTGQFAPHICDQGQRPQCSMLEACSSLSWAMDMDALTLLLSGCEIAQASKPCRGSIQSLEYDG